MAQNRDVLLQRETEPAYTRADFTALRAWLSKLPVSQISSLYYDEESLEVLGCSTNAALQRRLDRMRDYLADRAINRIRTSLMRYGEPGYPAVGRKR